MTDAINVLESMARDTGDLDTLSKRIYEATLALDAAEDAWDRVYDEVLADLEDEFAKAGRKSVPEHTAVSAARRAHRAEYVAWRNAARAVTRLQSQLKAKTAALNGRQTQFNALRVEGRMQDHPAMGRADYGDVIGGRRAA